MVSSKNNFPICRTSLRSCPCLTSWKPESYFIGRSLIVGIKLDFSPGYSRIKSRGGKPAKVRAE